MAKADAQELRRLIYVVEAKLAGLPKVDRDDLESVTTFHDEAKAALKDILAEESGAAKVDWRGAELRLGGISSSSTMGAEGAMRNWIKAATRRYALLMWEQAP